MGSNNPFAVAQRQEFQPPQRALANTDQQRAVAEVQAGMMLARMNPRDEVRSMDRILNACARPTLAESAVYTYSKGGINITGPSIRLAEAMAQAWGNLSFGIRELDQVAGESTVQAFCWDMETNVRREMTFQVSHIRYTKSGSRKIEDPREIYEHVANQGARRLRACILAVIPGDVTEVAVNQCEQTMSAQADTSPEAMKRMVDAFSAFGVTKEQIEKRIQRRIDAIQPAQVVSLRKIHNSLKDGMSTPTDWFEMPTATANEQQAQTSRTDAVKDALKKRKDGDGQKQAQAETKTETAPPPSEKEKPEIKPPQQKQEEPPLPEPPPEVATQGKKPSISEEYGGPDVAQLKEMIDQCKTFSEAFSWSIKNKNLIDALPKAEMRGEVNAYALATDHLLQIDEHQTVNSINEWAEMTLPGLQKLLEKHHKDTSADLYKKVQEKAAAKVMDLRKAAGDPATAATENTQATPARSKAFYHLIDQMQTKGSSIVLDKWLFAIQMKVGNLSDEEQNAFHAEVDTYRNELLYIERQEQK
jgi:hypothetical protein